MQSSFEVLEWESTSKTQDSLVHQLFGDISTSKLGTCSAVLESTCSATQQVNASKGEKRKTLKNEESTLKLKKTKQNKRQKNKFKQVQQLSSERSETTINKANEKNIDVTTAEIEGPVLGHMASEKPNGHERKKEKKGRKSNETKEKDVSSKTTKKNVKTTQKSNSQLTEERDSQSGTACDDEVISTRGTNQRAHIDSVSQLKVSVDTTVSLNVDVEKVLNNSIEGPNKSDGKKVKKKKKREKRRLDGSRDASAVLKQEECTSEVSNYQHKRRRKTSKSDQDSCCDKKISKHGPAIKDTNSNILSSSGPQSKSSLQEKMTKKLESSRFRWINEKLYTTTGDEAVAMFSKDPNLFDIYHRGFTNQVKLWPVNPVDKIIEWLKKR